MSYRTFKRLTDTMQGHGVIQRLWAELKPLLLAGQTFEIVVKPETRSTAQNARMWAMLNEISRQVVWHGRKLDSTDWKHIFSAAIKKQEVVPNIDGTGFVILGQSTSSMTKGELSDLMELIEAFGADHGVEFNHQAAA